MDDPPSQPNHAPPPPLAALLFSEVSEVDQVLERASWGNCEGRIRPDASGSPVSGEPAAAGGAEPPSSSSPAGDSPVTSLDTTETSVRANVEAFLNAPPEQQQDWKPTLCEEMQCIRFRHSGWWPMRRRIFAALERTNQTRSRLCAFGSCGAGAWIEQSSEDPTRYRVKHSHCHDRLCTPCANARSFNLSQALLHLIEGKPHTFITLTLCGKGEGLSELIDRLYKHFRALRLHPTWSEKVRGGAAFLEVKWSDKAQRWHPHLHIICDAGFIHQGELSSVWRGITKDSFIVDIRKVRDSGVSARYVTKYASKPLNASFSNTPKLLDEAIVALKGRRLCLCFGTWYGTALDALEDTDLADDLIDTGAWHSVGSLEETLILASHADAIALAILRSLDIESKWRQSLTLA